MMSGCGILTNGKGTRREYGVYNLDELQVCIVSVVCILFLKMIFKHLIKFAFCTRFEVCVHWDMMKLETAILAKN